MDTRDLAALVPDLMARHSACGWTALSGCSADEDLMIELYPLAWPERVATLRVNTGAEVFCFAFAGHHSHDFAYEDDDRPETLRERIDLAVEAISGPTRVILEQAGGTTIKSTLIVNPDGSNSRQDGVSYPIRRLKYFLKTTRITRKTADFPATPRS
jgi:hypothetical protein